MQLIMLLLSSVALFSPKCTECCLAAALSASGSAYPLAVAGEGEGVRMREVRGGKRCCAEVFKSRSLCPGSAIMVALASPPSPSARSTLRHLSVAESFPKDDDSPARSGYSPERSPRQFPITENVKNMLMQGLQFFLFCFLFSRVSTVQFPDSTKCDRISPNTSSFV